MRRAAGLRGRHDPHVPNPVLSEGRRAPAFTLSAHDGSRMRLTDLRGRWVVLFFYPRIGAASAAAARELRDRSGDFRRQQAQVLGVGCDSREAQREFARSLGLNFPLLSDPSSRVARRYGVWREKSSNGRAWIGLVRSTFLIDPSGRLARVLDNQRVKGHADKVLRALRAARSRD